ncbi:MAG: hypothetical protein ACYCVB_17970 [Bacilli bacterium]
MKISGGWHRKNRFIPLKRWRVLPSFLGIIWRNSPLHLLALIACSFILGFTPYWSLHVFKDVINVASDSLLQELVAVSQLIHSMAWLLAIQTVALLTGGLHGLFLRSVGDRTANAVTESVMERAAGIPYETVEAPQAQNDLYFLRRETASKP